MGMRDEVKEQQNKLKGKTFKEKLNYFWYYYRIHTAAAIFLIAVGALFIKDAVTAKDNAFSATLLNSYGSNKQDAFQADFAEYAGIDTTSYNCYIDNSSTINYETMSQMDMAVSQRIAAMTQTGGIDVMVSDLEPFGNYANGMLFTDLREELSDEEYEKYEDDFYYIDAAAAEAAGNDMLSLEEDMNETAPADVNPSDPDTMEDPVPVGIYLKDSAKLKEWECYTTTEDTPVFGFVYSALQKDYSHLFLKYLTD